MQSTRIITTMFFALLVVAIVSAATIALATNILLPSVFAQQEQQETLRLGYFPNINHAQAVIGLGKGDFQKALRNNGKVETFQFNAGPSAIESLLAKRIDVSYIGPNPAINGYVVQTEKE